jgi:hypothetical protein
MRYVLGGGADSLSLQYTDSDNGIFLAAVGKLKNNETPSYIIIINAQFIQPGQVDVALYLYWGLVIGGGVLIMILVGVCCVVYLKRCSAQNQRFALPANNPNQHAVIQDEGNAEPNLEQGPHAHLLRQPWDQ